MTRTGNLKSRAIILAVALVFTVRNLSFPKDWQTDLLDFISAAAAAGPSGLNSVNVPTFNVLTSTKTMVQTPPSMSIDENDSNSNNNNDRNITTTMARGFVVQNHSRTIEQTSKLIHFSHPPPTNVTKLSSGADLFENVCLVFGKKYTHGRPAIVSSYPIPDIPDKPPFLPQWLFWTNRLANDAALWNSLMKNPKRSIEGNEEILLLIPLLNNPGHCLNDLVFSLAMDRRERPSVTATVYYKRFVLLDMKHRIAEVCTSADYCCQLMDLLGFIQKDRLATTVHRDVCVSKLIVPRFSRHRLPKTTDEIQAIQDLQAHAFARLADRNITGEPWMLSHDNGPERNDSRNRNSSFDLTMKVPTILLKDRSDAKSRKLTNGKELQEALENQYIVKVERGMPIQQQQNQQEGEHQPPPLPPRLSVLEQAQLYNSHRNIIEVHGASMAHLFFARPHTKVFELQCVTPPRERKHIDTMAWQWYSSFLPILSIDYYQHLEHEGCLEQIDEGGGATPTKVLREDYAPENYTISDLPAMVELVAQHFGLHKRAK